MQKTVDYIVVGQGLSGSFLALELEKRGFKPLVIDRGFEQSSSWVAAGLINPLVLKRLTLTWRAKEFTGYNKEFYKKLNALFGKKLYQDLAIQKLISSEDEKHFWIKKLKSEEHKEWLKNELRKFISSPSSGQFDYGEVKNTGWLDVKSFLSTYRHKLKEENRLIEESFEYDSLKSEPNSFIYKNFIAKKIVFCEGARVKQNPYFNFVKMGLNKGELLELKSIELNLETIVKKKVFVLPLGNNKYKVGATYEWEWENEKPSEVKKQELTNGFKELFNTPITITSHEAGVRPSVVDRRPIMGEHADHKNLFIFNGMGSRACFMAPLLSKEMVDFIEINADLPKEVNLHRFKQD